MRNTVEELKQEQLDETQCWQAVLARNAAADGTFVVAVRTTRIYCRPSCPARHPYREHVTFYRLPEEKIRVVPLGVDGKFFEIAHDRRPESFLLSVTTNKTNKNLERLLRAFSRVPPTSARPATRA